MAVQVLREPGHFPSGELCRGADDCEPARRTRGHGHHVLRQLVAGPDAAVESLGDDVHHGVVGGDLQPDAGVFRQETDHHRLDDQFGGIARDVQAQQSRGLPPNALTLYMASAMSPRAGPIRRVFGSDGGHVGAVDHVEEDRIKLTKQDAPSGRALHNYYLPVSAVAAVEGREVRLKMDAYRARELATMTSAPEPTRGMGGASAG